MADHNALPLVILAEQFAKLPGIGMKTAQRLAYYVMSMSESDVQAFADAILQAKHRVHNCAICQNLTEQEVCPICGDDRRDHSIICVVESPKDVTAFERTGEYNGTYHVLSASEAKISCNGGETDASPWDGRAASKVFTCEWSKNPRERQSRSFSPPMVDYGCWLK